MMGLGVAADPKIRVARRHGPLVEVQGLAERGERPEQALGHEHQHAVGADGQLAGLGERPAVDQRGDEAADDDHADERRERRAEADGGAVGRLVVLAELADAGDLAGLGVEALDGGDAAEVVGELSAQQAHALADDGVARRDAGWK
jgi:hypothetical protein